VDALVVRPKPLSACDERGAALVEFALVVPLLMAVLLGIFTGGVAYFQKLTIVEAVREGARYGAAYLTGTGAAELASWEAAVKARVSEAAGGTLSGSEVCAKLVQATRGSDCGLADPPGASGETTVRLVKVSAVKQIELEFFFFDMSRAVSGQFVARYERDTG
jgi:Flp pilus assembly protein TadG